MSDQEILQQRLGGAQRTAAIIGLAALVACGAGALSSPKQFFQSYLLGYLFSLGLALGCLGWHMIHNLTGGNWGNAVRRMLESGFKTMPLMAVLIVPLFFGLPELYVWARPAEVARNELLRHKAAYLNVPFFTGRAVLYFGIWIAFALLLSKWSAQKDQGDGSAHSKLGTLSGPGLVILGLTITFAAVDWGMSLEPLWYSTIYGILFVVGQLLLSLAFVTFVLSRLRPLQPMSGYLTQVHFHDLGNLMLALVMVWAYVSFSQFLIIWSGNLPEEVTWYLTRMRGAWQYLAVFLLLCHFVIPFFLLLMRRNKKQPTALAAIAVALIVMRLADMMWLVVPALQPNSFRIHWMDIAAPVGLTGLWMAAFFWQLKSRSVLTDSATPVAAH